VVPAAIPANDVRADCFAAACAVSILADLQMLMTPPFALTRMGGAPFWYSHVGISLFASPQRQQGPSLLALRARIDAFSLGPPYQFDNVYRQTDLQDDDSPEQNTERSFDRLVAKEPHCQERRRAAADGAEHVEDDF